MSKKKKKKLDEGLVMISSLLPVGGVVGLLPKRVDNFKFKGLPGQFDEDGNKVLDESGQPIEKVGVLVENIRKHLENSKNKKDDAKEVFEAIKMYLGK